MHIQVLIKIKTNIGQLSPLLVFFCFNKNKIEKMKRILRILKIFLFSYAIYNCVFFGKLLKYYTFV